MGRRKKIEEYIRQTAEKEKQKIKESVLEVFRTRSKSPGGNGAFLVAASNDNINGTNKVSPGKNSNISGFGEKHLREVYFAADREHLEDTMSPPEQNSRSRKRKSNKTKGVKMKLHKTGDHVDMAQSHSASNLKYALRSAQDQKDQHARNAISRIASNRMTKRLGLFNQGKKSETILRAVYTSNGRQRTADEDLQDFLHKGSCEKDKINSPLSSQSRLVEKDSLMGISIEHSGPESGIRSDPSTCTHSITPASMPCSTAAPHSSHGSHASSCSSAVEEEHLPLIEEIVDQVLGRLNPQKIFPDKVDYVRETTDELRRIMRTNAPRSCTPTPSLQPCLSVKRSLLTRYLTPSKDKKTEEQTNPKFDATSNIKIITSKSEESKFIQISTCTSHMEPSKCKSRILSRSPFNPVQRQFGACFQDLSDFQSDAQTLLQCHDQVIAKANQSLNHLSSGRKDLSLEQLCNADGMDILKKHDEQSNRLVNQGWQKERKGENWMKDKENNWRGDRTSDERWKIERESKWTRNREKESWKQDKEENSWKSLFAEMHEFSSQSSTVSSGYQGSQILRETGNCKTEMIPAYTGPAHFPEFMPQFHDQDYYSGNHSSGMSNKIRSLDILEILDETGAPGSHRSCSRQDKYMSHSNRLSNADILDNLNTESGSPGPSFRDRTTQQERSLQRGTSQEEYHFFLKKPSLDTPSPPDELFKKHNLIS